MKKLTFNNKEVLINIASFRAASNLRRTITKIASEQKLDIENMELNDGILNKILPLLFKLDSNIEFENALFECLASCAYDSEKITPETFEPVQNREMYYPIVAACLEVNLKPFFQPLLAKLKKAEPATV